MDHKKWKVTQQWPTPTSVKELQLFLGSVNYLSKFIPYLSDFRRLPQELLKKENKFYWMSIYNETFRKLKSAIVKDMMLKYFDVNLPIYIETDASKKSIGVALMQSDPNKICRKLLYPIT